MGVFSEVTDEFKKAGNKERVLIVLGVAGVAGVAYYLYTHQVSGAAQGTQAGPPASQQAGYPTVGPNGTPVIPGGVTPIYDPSGNLVAFQNPLVNNGPVPGPGGTPNNWYTSLLGTVGYGAQIKPGGIDNLGQRFWIGPGNNNLFYAPVGSKINYGANGRIWITPPGGQQQLLTGPGKT